MVGSVTRSDETGDSPDQTRSAANDGDSAEQTETDKRTILWIDDAVDNTWVRLLELEGFRTDCATTGSSGLARARSHRYDAYIIDLQLPDMYGLSVLERLVAEGSQVPALVLTGCYTEYESEQLARHLGAEDFRCKPIAAEDLALTLRSMVVRRAVPRLAADPRLTASAVPPSKPQPRFGIIAASAAMRSVFEWIDRVGPTTMPVLITGETGTGKELVARALHERSGRCSQAFIPINCSAFPEGLLETELFGHRRGAFTGAFQNKKGLLEQAANGTVFLDEIGDMTLSAQSRFLRFLDDGELRRVGDTRSSRIDVRVIAATNRSLVDECARGRFRSDLFFRLAVARMHIPSLRERPDDIDALVEHFLLLGQAARSGRKRVLRMCRAALGVLRDHPWPGTFVS